MSQPVKYKFFFINRLLWLCIGIVFFCAGHTYSDDRYWIQEEGSRVGEIYFEILGSISDPDSWKKIAKNRIQMKRGTIFSSQKIDQAINDLKSTGLFVVEEVQTRKNAAGDLDIHFQLKIISRIQDIKIAGNFPLFEREVLNNMTVDTGDAFQKEKLPEQCESIVQLLKDQGYTSPEVTIQSIQDKDNGHYVLHVDLRKGDFFKIEDVELQGNRSFSGTRLKMRLQTWKASFLPGSMSRYQKKELDEDVKTLLSFYRNNYHPEAAITPVVVKDDLTQKVRIVLQISEGPLYEIQFKGNDQFWDWTLKGDLQLFREGVANNFWIRKTARMIRDRYDKKGYMDCQVNSEIILENIDGEDLRRICFTIEEGARSIVTDLKVIGNESIAEDEIRKQIITNTQGLLTTGEFNKQVLDDDIQGVMTLYLREGYLDAKVDEEIVWTNSQDHKEKYADICLRIHEGQKILVSSIKFIGLSCLSEDQAMKILVMKPSDPFREYMLENDQNKLSMHISEMGYPHVKIQGEKIIDRQKEEAHITYKISQGIFVSTGKVLTVGNFRTRKQVVEKEFALEEGKPFSMMKMIEGQRNIQNINAFKTARVKPIGLKEASEEVDFLVEVEEKKPYAAQASMGYDTSRQLYLKTRLSDLNLFGLNKEAWIGLEVSQIGNHGELGIAEPHLLDTRISAVTNLFWEKREELNKSFGTESYGLTVSFTRKLPHNLSTNLVVGYERKEQYLRDRESFSESDEEAYDPRGIMVTSPSLVYNSVDSFIRPRKGVFSSIGVDFSKGLENSLDNFIKYRYEARMYFQIHERIIFATRGRVGHIVPSGDNSVISEDQLFFLGGLSSVRGYDENRLRIDQTGDALGGRTEIVGSFESRFDIGFNLELSPFFDIGSVRDALIDEGSDSFRSSIGLSLRYLTPYCPIGIQYGYKLDKIETDEEKGRFYFTIGYTF